MDDSAFSDGFCDFVQTTVPTVEAAELLLVVARMPAAWWTAEELLAKLPRDTSVSPAEGQRYLDRFRAAGLLAVNAEKKMLYQPASAGLAEHVCTLWRAYQERPVTLIRLIYALRDASIRSFSDAFALRR